MMREAVAETRNYQREQTRIQADKALAELKAKGMTFNEIAPAEYARMQQATKPVAERFCRRFRSGQGQAVQRRAGAHPQGELGAPSPATRQQRARPRWAGLIDLYCRLLKCTIAICLAVMVVLVFGNVVLRYAFNSGITMSEELSRWLMVWLTFLGAIVALREHAHLGVDTLVRALPPAGKRICFLLSYGLMLYADWLLLAGSWRQTIITAGDRAPATNLSVGLFYGAGIVFGVSAGVILIYDLVRVLTGAASEEDLVAVRESEEL